MKKNAEEEVVVMTATEEVAAEEVVTEETSKAAPKAKRTRTKAPKIPEGATEDAPKEDTVHPISEENEEEILKTAQELLGGTKATSADEAKKFCNILERIAKQLDDSHGTGETIKTSVYDFGDSLDDEDELDEDYFEDDEDDVLGLPMSKKSKIAIAGIIVVSAISAIITIVALFKKK